MGTVLKIFAGLVFFSPLWTRAGYGFDISKTLHPCQKASVTLNISGKDSGDVVSINWSSGQVNVYAINDVDEGNYSLVIKIKRLEDTAIVTTADTTIYFTVEKPECPVSVTALITPNGDGHNDMLYISNVQNYPHFELDVFNKWGQRVHTQKESYVPWDATSVGIQVPDGTYYYIFIYDTADKNKLLKGSITILR